MSESKTKVTPVEIEGYFAWAKVFDFNRERVGYQGSYEGTGGACEIDVFMDREQLKKLADSGSSKRPKKDGVTGEVKKYLINDDGQPVEDADGDLWCVKFGRKWDSKVPAFGGAPQVVHADGETAWDPQEDGLIGNGSYGVVYNTVNDWGGQATLTRLEVVQIIDLLEYESDYDPEESSNYTPVQVKSREAPKKPVKKPAAKKKAPVEKDLEDDLPFNEGVTP